MRFAMMVTKPAWEHFTGMIPEVQLEYNCIVDMLLVDSNEHAYQLYEEHWELYDAFVFAGKVLMYSITKKMRALKKPCFAMEDSSGNLHDILLHKLIGNRQFDFSRVYVDTATHQNDYLGLRELLPREQWPLFSETKEIGGPLNILEGDAYRVTEAVLSRHIQLHREKRIDLSITQFGAIVEKLDQLDIPNEYILPTREYVLHFFHQVALTMGRDSEEDVMGCICIRAPGNVANRRALVGQISVTSQAYAVKNGYDFSIVWEKDVLYILTPRADLQNITGDFHSVRFQEHLSPSGTPLYWGLGSGMTMFQAKRNAASALEVSRHNKGNVYYVSGDSRVSGPIGREDEGFTLHPTDELLQVAQKFHLNHVNLQKIIAFTRLSGSITVTAEELANYLNITPRSVNRLLGRIVEGGGARVYTESAGGGRGRPKKQYELTFLLGTESNSIHS